MLADGGDVNRPGNGLGIGMRGPIVSAGSSIDRAIRTPMSTFVH